MALVHRSPSPMWQTTWKFGFLTFVWPSSDHCCGHLGNELASGKSLSLSLCYIAFQINICCMNAITVLWLHNFNLSPLQMKEVVTNSGSENDP